MPDAHRPRVTVFMPVYDRAHVLAPAIQSLLAQRFRDFELLVVDDGSKDGSPDVVRAFAARDPRIRLVIQDRNRGIPHTRNRGIALARGEYLANADSDDTSLPERLERQVAFLDAHPGIAAVGSWMIRTDESGTRYRGPLLRPTRPRDIRARILFTSCFKNPTMMARTQVLREFGFRERFVISSDIDLWSRVSEKHALANLPAFLVRYRAGGTSHQPSAPRTRMRAWIARDLLSQLGVDFDESDLARHVRLRNLGEGTPEPDLLAWADDWLARLHAANARTRAYPEPELGQASAERWLLLLARGVAAGTARAADLRRAPAYLARLRGAHSLYGQLLRGAATARLRGLR